MPNLYTRNMTIKTVDYAAPRILARLSLELEHSLLNSSVTEALNLAGVDTMGQEVEEKDFSNENYFKHEWQ